MELPEAVVDVMVSLRGWLQVCPLIFHGTVTWTQGAAFACSVKCTLCLSYCALGWGPKIQRPSTVT